MTWVKINDEHLTSYADSIRYAKDGSEYRTILERAREEMRSIIDRSIVSFEDYNIETIGECGFCACKNLVRLNAPNIISLAPYALSGCTSLKNISFPKITSINGQAVFDACTSLESVYLPKVTFVQQQTFYSCSSLTDVFMPEVTDLGYQMTFLSCRALERIFLPNLESLKNKIFEGCSSLVVICLDKRVTLSNLNSIPSQTIIYVNPDDLEWFSTATNWSTIYADNRIKTTEDLTGDDLIWYQEQLERYEEVHRNA